MKLWIKVYPIIITKNIIKNFNLMNMVIKGNEEFQLLIADGTTQNVGGTSGFILLTYVVGLENVITDIFDFHNTDYWALWLLLTQFFRAVDYLLAGSPGF